jgi:hypothetical protein
MTPNRILFPNIDNVKQQSEFNKLVFFKFIFLNIHGRHMYSFLHLT